MTNGLLISRNNKKVLYKTSLAIPTAENVKKYENFKTMYQRVLRAARNCTSSPNLSKMPVIQKKLGIR